MKFISYFVRLKKGFIKVYTIVYYLPRTKNELLQNKYKLVRGIEDEWSKCTGPAISL